MPDLKPCPFCGGAPTLMTDTVECHSCSASHGLQDWNRRSSGFKPLDGIEHTSMYVTPLYEWKPIDTAPKDSDGPYLLWGEDWIGSNQTRIGYRYGDDWLDGDGGGLRPTHWMPLPDGPGDEA